MSELPKGWIDARVSEVAKVESGVGFPKKFQGMETDHLPVYKVGDISRSVQSGESSLNSSSNYIDESTRLAMKGKIYPEGSTLFAKIGEALKLNRRGFLSRAGLADNNVMGVIPDKLTKGKYLYYLLKTVDLSSFSRSSAVPSIRKGDVEDLTVPLPPLPEQKRIVEKLDEVLAQVDTIKARLDGIPDLLKRFRQSVLASAVSGKLIPVNESRIVKVGDISEDIRYGTSKKCDYKGGSTPVIRIPNIGDRRLDISDLKSADFTEKELDKLTLQSGDILVIRSNGSLDLVAKPAIVEPQYEGFLYAGYLIRIRCDRELILPSFLLNVLSSRVVRDVVELGARSTSGVNNINSKELAALEFVLPSMDEQKEIVRLVDQYFAFADTIEAQVKKAQARVDSLTQSILAKAFRGELVPQNDDDEPAEVLLKRIAQARKEAEALAKAAKKAGKKKA
ncbi:restriction endonuclease subunit S [Vibrio sp. J1-1]|uniref:restriction endonuclease subunit S n=1 Tax=Vibrio sp. J1-1 TaxID=2912251 RepID=UPI001F016423|nr:restriction endonuclease subunit S [Vibrio sp. J1-1]MCF7482926.1 restriction endonuclease subunit S [Vibrio sp. J1-1]